MHNIYCIILMQYILWYISIYKYKFIYIAVLYILIYVYIQVYIYKNYLYLYNSIYSKPGSGGAKRNSVEIAFSRNAIEFCIAAWRCLFALLLQYYSLLYEYIHIFHSLIYESDYEICISHFTLLEWNVKNSLNSLRRSSIFINVDDMNWMS